MNILVLLCTGQDNTEVFRQCVPVSVQCPTMLTVFAVAPTQHRSLQFPVSSWNIDHFSTTKHLTAFQSHFKQPSMSETSGDGSAQSHRESFIAGLQSFICTICQCPPTDAIRLDGCDHIFCRECITNLARSSYSKANRCPNCRIELYQMSREEQQDRNLLDIMAALENDAVHTGQGESHGDVLQQVLSRSNQTAAPDRQQSHQPRQPSSLQATTTSPAPAYAPSTPLYRLPSFPPQENGVIYRLTSPAYSPSTPAWTPSSPAYSPHSPPQILASHAYTPTTTYSPRPPHFSSSQVYTPTTPAYTPTAPAYSPRPPQFSVSAAYTPSSLSYSPRSPAFRSRSPSNTTENGQ